jgi:hypothetical protein
LAQPSASNAASTLLVAIKTNVMERSPIGEGVVRRDHRTDHRSWVKRESPLSSRENSGLGLPAITSAMKQ